MSDSSYAPPPAWPQQPSPPRKRRGTGIAVPLVAAGLVAILVAWHVAAGHASNSAASDAPPAAVETAPFIGALDALTTDPEVRYQTTISGVGPADVTVTNFGQAVGTVTADDGVYQVLELNGTLYVKPPASDLPAVSNPLEAAAMKGKWLTGSSVQSLLSLSTDSFVAPSQLATQLITALGSHPALAAQTTIAGIRAVSADSSMGVLYVSAAAPYRILRITPTPTASTSSSEADARIYAADAASDSGDDMTFPTDTPSDEITNIDNELEQDTRQLATGSMDTDLNFNIRGNGSINCSAVMCSVSVSVTSSVSTGSSAKITGGSVSADLDATVTIEGQAAGTCTDSGSFPLNSIGLLGCDDYAAGPVFASVDAEKKAAAEQQSEAENGAEVPYRVNYSGEYYVYATAQVNVDELEQQISTQAKTEGALEDAHSALMSALQRALKRTPAEVRDSLSEAQLEAGRNNPSRQSQYVGTSIENAVADDPAVALNPDITHFGSGAPGTPVTDFRIQVGGETIDIDITGSSASSLASHLGRSYISSGDQLLLYPTLPRGFLNEVFR
jgi:hypothetical protein